MGEVLAAAHAVAKKANRITLVVMLSLLLAQACHRKAFTQHTKPAWKRTSLHRTDPEQANPTRL